MVVEALADLRRKVCEKIAERLYVGVSGVSDFVANFVRVSFLYMSTKSEAGGGGR